MTITLSTRVLRLLTALMLVTTGVGAGMAVSAVMAGAAGGPNEDLAYTAVTPCAAFDSRTGTGPFAGPYLGDFGGPLFNGVNNKTVRVTGAGLTNIGGETQGANDDCGIPAGVSAVHINIVAIAALTTGNVVVVDAGGTPSGGIVNYQVLSPGLNNSNAHSVPVSAAGELDVYANCGAGCVAPTVHVRGVVLGYYTNELSARVVELEALLAGITRDAAGNLTFPSDVTATNINALEARVAILETPTVTLDSAGDVGTYTSVAVGTDGYPIISYRDNTNRALKVVHCTDVVCSTSDTPLVLDFGHPITGDVGSDTSIAVGTDGFPIISYYDLTNDDLKVVHCTNTSCSNFDVPLTLDSTGNVGQYTSIAVGTDGYPIISYYGSGDLKVVHCTAADCSTTDTPLTLDSAGDVGQYTSVAVGTDGYPIISYWDGNVFGGNQDLKVVHCTAANCSTTDTPLTLDSTGNVGQYTSIAVGTDGYPIISYYDETNLGLKVVHCTTTDCSTTDTPLTLDSTGTDFVGEYTSIAVGTDGYPIISYGSGDLKVVHCTAADCSTTDAPLTLDSAGFYTSIAVATDGFPIISYKDLTNNDLKVARLAP